ncbi:M61 family metallopeptidase [Pedobacter alpinus]|uniref:M61 family metallopeptidase n=1 Tax=Pedobacter alpinus TaxID=1590643 RepID=A0ABW5TMY8_9SPHI
MKKTLLLLFIFTAALQIKAQEAIQYTVSFENAVHHEATISMYVTQLTTEPLIVRVSRSSPGRYATHEFGKNIYDVKAYNADGKEIIIEQTEGDVYTVPQHQDKVKITYTLFGNWVDGTYTGIDSQHAHLNMPASFMWIPALQNRPITVKFVTPQNWKIATQLILKDGFYHAPNLQYFMDSPTELSNYDVKTWEVENADGLKQQINIVLHGKTSDSTFNDFETKVKKVVKEAQAVFGELPKFDNGEYRFLIDVLPTNAGDGMEHRNSTIITNKSESLDKSANRILGTVSHEFFHAWNVERIRPQSLEPFNFEKANMSESLWFAEGFTQYYGELLLARAGINSAENFAKTQGRFLNSVLNAPGANKYSPIFMSKRAVFVDAGVSIDKNNHGNIFSSYYIYGNITALALDLTLRTQFNLNLDDYMKAVWQAYGKPEKPYQLSDLQNVLASYTQSPDFAKLFFEQYIYGTEKANYKTLLAKFGYVLKLTNAGKAWIGNEFLKEDNGKIIISSAAIKGSPIYEAGLEEGDKILKFEDGEIAGLAVMPEFLKAPIGYTVKVTFERNNEIMETKLTLLSDPNLEVISFEEAGLTVTPEIETLRQNWLGSKSKN